MSYDVNIYVADEPFPVGIYRKFVTRTFQIGGAWSCRESRELDLDAQAELHAYCVTDRQDIGREDWDPEKDVGVFVTLYRNQIEYCEPVLRRFPHVIHVETKACRSFLSSIVQFSIPALAFDVFKEVVIEEVDDPQKQVHYTRKEDFLLHVAKSHLTWHG
jgi:hypothetical protein